MKTGNCIAVTGNVDKNFAEMKALGYETADVQLADTREPWYHDTAKMSTLCSQVRQTAEKYGIELFQIHGPWPTDDTTAASRAEGWDYMHRSVYACHLLGAKYMVLHPQRPYSWREDEDPDFPETLTLALLQDLLPDCEKYDVTLCLENMPFRTQRLSTMERIAAVVEKAHSSHVGICLDTGHVNVFEGHDLGDAVRLASPYLKVLHVHDNDGTGDRHMLPYLGTANWDSFTTALAESGYDGPISMETQGPVSTKMPPHIQQHAKQLTAMTARYLADEVERKRK